MTPIRNRFARWVTILSLLGLGLSVVSLFEYTRWVNGLQTAPSFCSLNAIIDCDKVTQSNFATLFGVPLASYGVAFYLGLLFFSLLSSTSEVVAEQVYSRVVVALGFLVTIASLALFIISSVYIKALCLLCIGLYLINLMLFGLGVISVRGQSLFAAIFMGLVGLVRLPFVALGRPHPMFAGVARAGLLNILLSLFVAYSLPDFLLGQLILPEFLAKQSEAALPKGETLKAWQGQPERKIAVTSVSSPMQDYTTGNPDAPIQMVEFSDFECPACRNMYKVVKKILDRYEGKVFFVTKDFPLDNACNPTIDHQFHQNSCYAALVARCAGEQGQFWPVFDMLFTLPAFDDGKPSEEIKRAITSKLNAMGLDLEGLDECMNSSRPLGKIHSDIKEAVDLKLQGTPMIWINGRLVAQPSEEGLVEIVEAILASAATN